MIAGSKMELFFYIGRKKTGMCDFKYLKLFNLELFHFIGKKYYSILIMIRKKSTMGTKISISSYEQPNLPNLRSCQIILSMYVFGSKLEVPPSSKLKTFTFNWLFI